MESGRQPPIRYIERTREQYQALGHGVYQWAEISEPPAWTEVTRPLNECRLGLIATGGIYQVGQIAFTHKDDTTHRAIPTDCDTDTLRTTHFAYDLTDARRDINVIFPLDTLRDLVGRGEIGSLSEHAYTCMGGIYSQRRVHEELAPPLVQCCLTDEVDLVLLAPA